MPRVTARTIQEAANDKKRNSFYFITISTNKKPKTPEEDQAIRDGLESAIDEQFNDPAVAEIIHFNKPGHFYDDRFIQEIETAARYETGTKGRGGRVHAHLTFKVWHTSNITVSRATILPHLLPKVQARLPEFNITNLYINVRLMRNEEEAVRKYQEKKDLGRLVSNV